MGVLRSRSSPDAGAPAVACRVAASPTELEQHYGIRRAVFVYEQRLFAADDRDEHDDDPRTFHVLGFVGSVAEGTVRLYPTPSVDEPGLWKGDRLAVLTGRRAAGLGGPLVRYAVATAGSAGGTRMVAWIQMPNVAFFTRLGWEAQGEPAPYVGRPHQQMSIGLRA